MSRAFTRYESERFEQMMHNWVASKLGASLSRYAATSAYDDQIDARTEAFETRYPVLQEQADQVDAVVYGRLASQFLAARAPMRVELREPLEHYYLGTLTHEHIARKLKIARQTVTDRLKAARWTIWEAVSQKSHSAENRASACVGHR